LGSTEPVCEQLRFDFLAPAEPKRRIVLVAMNAMHGCAFTDLIVADRQRAPISVIPASPSVFTKRTSLAPTPLPTEAAIRQLSRELTFDSLSHIQIVDLLCLQQAASLNQCLQSGKPVSH
jgi:hypothetical protein